MESPSNGERVVRWLFIGAGVAITPAALFLAVMSGGAGHGHYVMARIMFPLPMLLTLFSHNIGVVSVIMAIAQYPLYGAIIGLSTRRIALAVFVGIFHAILMIIAFSGVLPYAS